MSESVMQYFVTMAVSAIYKFYLSYSLAKVYAFKASLIPEDAEGLKDSRLWGRLMKQIQGSTIAIVEENHDYCDMSYVAILEDGSKVQVCFEYQQICRGDVIEY